LSASTVAAFLARPAWHRWGNIPHMLEPGKRIISSVAAASSFLVPVAFHQPIN
jgi:hypothetical protein